MVVAGARCRKRSGRAAVAGLLAAVLAGCAGTAAGEHSSPERVAASPSPARTAAFLMPQSPDCPSVRRAVHLRPPLPAADTPAFLCGTLVRRVPGEGRWLFSVVRRVTGGLPRLLRAYATPDRSTPAGKFCPAIGYIPFYVWLGRDRQRVILNPSGECGVPQSAAVRAYHALRTVQVSARKLRRVQTEASLASGCDQQVKDVLALSEPARRPGSHPGPIGHGVRACWYRVAHPAAAVPSGSLTGARTLSPGEVTRVDRALRTATVDRHCPTTGSTRFVLLVSGLDRGRQDWTAVSLSGCAVEQAYHSWRAGGGLRRLLAPA